MGYQSNVTIVFYTRNAKAVPPASIKLWFDENYPREAACTEWQAKIDYDAEHGWVMVTYEDVKWYGGYVHPTEVHRVTDRFVDAFGSDEDGDCPVAYEMVRVGEEISDITEERSDWSDYRLGVSRQIMFA